MTRNLPNLITAARVAIAPVISYMLLHGDPWIRFAAFWVFVLAALSDLWDGHLARSRGQITDFGKVVDPIADKLLLICTLIPLYVVTSRDLELAGIPIFGQIPLWVVIVLLGRELLITLLRLAAAKRGQVVAARRLGKRKAVAQNIFIGAAILWITFRGAGFGTSGGFWSFFRDFHGWFTATFLAVALILTVASMVLYLLTFSRIFGREYT